MAYNLQSLINIVEQILLLDHQHWILDEKAQIESLLEKASSLQHILESNSSLTSSKELQDLESQIRDAAHRAEDIVESPTVVVNFNWELQKVIDEFDAAKEEVIKFVDASEIQDVQPSSLVPGIPSTPDPSNKNFVVGFDEDLIQLKDRLTGWESKLKIIPIVEMGGSGKTTLARKLYDDPLVVSHFDILAWSTISQDYNLRSVLLGLLGCIFGKLSEEMLKKEDDILALDLHKSLSGRRYIIVLDDMWSTNVWDDIKRLFPNNNSGSRIVLTTRESNVATYADPKRKHHQMHFLNEVESWKLLREKVFAQEDCPPYFEYLGKKIANNCRGLPLAIAVTGGLLSTSKQKQDLWENVADNISSFLSDEDQFKKILSLTYNHLPSHLKPCFLYFGAFPEDSDIKASKLIKLWVAEGFLKPIGGKTLEEAAKFYLKDLVDRNLIFVGQREYCCSNDQAKTFRVHDLLRDLCMRKAIEEKFLYVKNWLVHIIPDDTTSPRRLSLHSSYFIKNIYNSVELMSRARSIIYVGDFRWAVLPRLFPASIYLRLLDVFNIEFFEFPLEILQLRNLRYLALFCRSGLPSSISSLCNLQTLILGGSFFMFSLPSELWCMKQLRHLEFKETSVWFYPLDFALLENLQTLSGINMFDDHLYKLLESIPNLKKLAISCDILVENSVDLTILEKLETLKVSTETGSPDVSAFLSHLTFPPSLRKLTLKYCMIPLGFIKTVGSLPNLEVLKLRSCSLQSRSPEGVAEWEEAEFCKLQFLLLEDLNLVSWKAEQDNFPRLQCLVIRGCDELEEIPSGIGEIPSLETIEVYDSSEGVVDSARRIMEEQHDYGNYDLQVRIHASSK